MKSRIDFYCVLVLICLMLVPYRSLAQSDEIGTLVKASINDANTLAKAYLSPMIKGFGAGLNTGWIHSGSPGDFPHFYIGVQSGLAFIPSSDHRFDVSTMALESLYYVDGPTMSPTVNGPERDGPRMKIMKAVNGTMYEVDDITLPQGTGLNFAPAPVIQAGVGLLYDTQLMLRIVPKITVRDASTYSGYMSGFGVQHGLNQWLPDRLSIPVDLSVMFGYTLIKSRVSLDIFPGWNPAVTNPYPSETWDNQHIRTRTTAFTMNLVAGKKFSVLHLYGGFGFENSKTSISTRGNYPTTIPDPQSGDPYHEKIDELINPIDFSVNGNQTMHLLAGMKIDLAVVKLFTDFTLTKYPIVSGGIGFGW